MGTSDRLNPTGTTTTSPVQDDTLMVTCLARRLSRML
ncbi:uncharacterized protein METZ01_LOCUS31659 [marine metagenome]|uniref:Uncharacterized protein n=1 Tax=marine metagenome TaxID=408172 RepID=A0A381QHJ3_9ZZZZ